MINTKPGVIFSSSTKTSKIPPRATCFFFVVDIDVDFVSIDLCSLLKVIRGAGAPVCCLFVCLTLRVVRDVCEGSFMMGLEWKGQDSIFFLSFREA